MTDRERRGCLTSGHDAVKLYRGKQAGDAPKVVIGAGPLVPPAVSSSLLVPKMKTDSLIASLIESFPVPASFKEADTGRYVVSNAHNSRQLGIEDPMDLVGLTINDVRLRQPEWGAQYAHAIEALDFRARDSKSHVIGKHHFLDDNGEVRFEEMLKFPVLGAAKNVLGIVTYRHDITSALGPSALYWMYRKFYDADNAIGRAMACLRVERFFVAPPTDAQFRIFLMKMERMSNKEIAHSVGSSVRTVECHLNALRNKIVDGDLSGIISILKKGGADAV
ncbi:PAS domain-containing protein [Trinickia sp.]|uniref:PAS domain-containing protein n=1 Tax=Trinickia sp. TaxID=2571163 RepID=UPI003F7E8B65